jgi:hypothetical protein
MVCNETRPVTRVKVDRVAILRGLAIAARKSVTILPEHITCHARGRERSRLPAAFDSCTFVTVADCVVSVKAIL